MERLYFVQDIMERYRYKDPRSAKKIMQQMGAQGKPMYVRESQIEEFDRMKTTKPERKHPARTEKPNRKQIANLEMLIPRI